jgi:hypothetical protein
LSFRSRILDGPQGPSDVPGRVEQVKRLVTPLRLRTLGADAGREVTWLELFFDLIKPVEHDPS